MALSAAGPTEGRKARRQGIPRKEKASKTNGGAKGKSKDGEGDREGHAHQANLLLLERCRLPFAPPTWNKDQSIANRPFELVRLSVQSSTIYVTRPRLWYITHTLADQPRQTLGDRTCITKR